MLSLAGVRAAQQILHGHVWRTPLILSDELARLAGGPVYLKLECWQYTGSFKLRGAFTRLATLSPEERVRGVVTASAGNHALGVAHAARTLHLAPVVIFVPSNASLLKVHRLAGLGCQVRHGGADYDAAHALATAYALEHGMVYVSAYDDPEVIAGQGTVGLEILEDVPHAGVLLVPVGGGGLIAGVALAAKAMRPAIRIVGVQPEASPAAYLSLRDGHPYECYAAAPTICDGLAGGFGQLPFDLVREQVDEVLLVPEVAIREAVVWLLEHEQLVVEGSGAIAVAPLISGQLQSMGEDIVCVLTGRNIEAHLLRTLVGEAASK